MSSEPTLNTSINETGQQESPPPQKPPRRKSRRRGRLGCIPTVLLIGLMAFAIVALVGGIFALVTYNSLEGEIETDMAILESMQGVEDFESSRIYDRDGELLFELFGEGRRTEISIDEIPFVVRWAVIATEDNTFYQNPGFDPQSIARAALEWYQEGEIVSGGSTITQQLVRQIVFDYEERQEQTLRRKLKEAALAFVMTQRMSKDEILALYLNEVYFGNLAYGIEGASNVYFGQPASQLTMGEAAFLIGLIQSPVAYDPYADFEIAKGRQRQVLDLMVLHGYITQSEADATFAQSPLSVDDLASPDIPLQAPHFTVEVQNQLVNLPGIDAEVLRRGGLRIETTIDLDIQALAQQVVVQRVAEVQADANLNNAALIALHPYTGEVLAMVGSVDYANEAIDGAVNNTTALHQPGSSIKPITYALALEQGWTAADIIWDVPMAYDTGIGAGYDYEPVNYTGRFSGPVRFRDALAQSLNIPAVTVLREVGIFETMYFARSLGLESLQEDPAYYGLSLTLGGPEVRPIEMATAYAAFANGGLHAQPHLISRVTGPGGVVIYEAPREPGERVIDERVAFLISDILSDNRARTPAMGEDSPLLLDFPAAAKTGTTNDFRDNWTIGYTPHLVVAVWAGNTDNSPMAEGTSGLTGAAPIWNDFMEALYAREDLRGVLEHPALPELGAPFEAPEGLVRRPVCVLSSLREPVPAEQGCPRTRDEWFIEYSPEERIELYGEPTPTGPPLPTFTPRVDELGTPQPDLPQVRLTLEPGIVAIGVLPVTEDKRDIARDLWETLLTGLPSGLPDPVTPVYCEVPQDRADVEGLQLLLFISAPSDPVDALRARNWAFRNNWPIDPGLPCGGDLLSPATPTPDPNIQAGVDPDTGATYNISSPGNDQEIWGIVPVVGTALFDPLRVQYYKVEYQVVDGSPNPWITIGETHADQVSNGVLEVFHAEALAPGRYLLRLALVRVDGSELPHFVVPVTILSGPPTPTPAP